jgi:hypothetical protein
MVKLDEKWGNCKEKPQNGGLRPAFLMIFIFFIFFVAFARKNADSVIN